jgi:hypothetical protein
MCVFISQLHVSAHKGHHQALYNMLIGKEKCYYHVYSYCEVSSAKLLQFLILIKMYIYCDDGRGTKTMPEIYVQTNSG